MMDLLRRSWLIIGMVHLLGAVVMLLNRGSVPSVLCLVVFPLPTAIVIGRRLHAVDAILATFILTTMTWVPLLCIRRELSLVFVANSPVMFSEMVVGALIGAALRYAASGRHVKE
jgi:hypothetical protein